MTRAELADRLQDFVATAPLSHAEADALLALVPAAVTELRKTCATCRHFYPETVPSMCASWSGYDDALVPDDGTGYCHRHEATP